MVTIGTASCVINRAKSISVGIVGEWCIPTVSSRTKSASLRPSTATSARPPRRSRFRPKAAKMNLTNCWVSSGASEIGHGHQSWPKVHASFFHVLLRPPGGCERLPPLAHKRDQFQKFFSSASNCINVAMTIKFSELKIRLLKN